MTTGNALTLTEGMGFTEGSREARVLTASCARPMTFRKMLKKGCGDSGFKTILGFEGLEVLAAERRGQFSKEPLLQRSCSSLQALRFALLLLLRLSNGLCVIP